MTGPGPSWYPEVGAMGKISGDPLQVPGCDPWGQDLGGGVGTPWPSPLFLTNLAGPGFLKVPRKTAHLFNPHWVSGAWLGQRGGPRTQLALSTPAGLLVPGLGARLVEEVCVSTAEHRNGAGSRTRSGWVPAWPLASCVTLSELLASVHFPYLFFRIL